MSPPLCSATVKLDGAECHCLRLLDHEPDLPHFTIRPYPPRTITHYEWTSET